MKQRFSLSALLSFRLHPPFFILSSSVREETFEYTDPQPYGAFHQYR
jgi:hypothetical protein